MSRHEKLRPPEVEAPIQAAYEAGENCSEIGRRFGLNKNQEIGMARRRGWVYGGTSTGVTRHNPVLRRAREFLRLPPVHRYDGATLFTRLAALERESILTARANIAPQTARGLAR